MKKVLFVCTANVCRSPMAEAIFDALAEAKGFGYRAESAGVRALVDEPMVPRARAALEELGFRAEPHRARQVSNAMVEEADLTLAMAPWHVAELRRSFGASARGVRVLPEYLGGDPDERGIPDPYGGTMAAYRASARQLLCCVQLLVSRLEEETLPAVGSPNGSGPHRRTGS